MSRFWGAVIRPFLVALDAAVIIEIGAAAGKMTVKLLEFANPRGGTVHVIEPAPSFDVDDFAKRFGACMRLHRGRSHDVLEAIGPVDAVLIDGDHNWHTVLGELRRLEATARRHAADFPLVALHDVDWPYARRDLYYDPDSIPEQDRRPWRRQGIVYGQSRLADEGGTNSGLANALDEGGPQNGVLTAVEDFLAESPLPLEFQRLPGFGGLGILVTEELLESVPAVRAQWERLESPAPLARYADILSAIDTPQAQAACAEVHRRLRG
jgi:Methyltransferase domain